MTRRSQTRLGFLGVCAALTIASSNVASATTTPPSTEPMGSEPMGNMMTNGPLCAAVPMEGEGSAVGMADDPVGTAASNNPLLTTLVAAVSAAGLEDTLNGEGPFTVFAPINSAFDKIDPGTLEDLLADPDTLTAILTYHVLPEQLSGTDLTAGGTFTTVNGAELAVAQVNETLVINGGAAAVQCADVQTANATVYLIDTVLMPPAADEGAATTEAVATSMVATTDAAVETTAPAVETTAPVVETTAPAMETTVPAIDTTVAVETTAAG